MAPLSPAGLSSESWSIMKNMATELGIVLIGYFTLVPAIQRTGSNRFQMSRLDHRCIHNDNEGHLIYTQSLESPLTP
ncbi:hypothetical protein E5288_WYG018838 [Bos mutus]|uniref:Uncharacterized protein n=1 Tax=Bos mutus TaxID=72004 RepID=A0A6B0R5T7_9CETA|nr:hypothetical protein [Bos mutus]